MLRTSIFGSFCASLNMRDVRSVHVIHNRSKCGKRGWREPLDVLVRPAPRESWSYCLPGGFVYNKWRTRLWGAQWKLGWPYSSWATPGMPGALAVVNLPHVPPQTQERLLASSYSYRHCLYHLLAVASSSSCQEHSCALFPRLLSSPLLWSPL